jgi:SAM-dependent methyltransferase
MSELSGLVENPESTPPLRSCILRDFAKIGGYRLVKAYEQLPACHQFELQSRRHANFFGRYVMQISRWLSRFLKNPPQHLLDSTELGRTTAGPTESTQMPAYLDRVAAETAIFAEQVIVHDLPPIYHYWSNTYLRPQLETFGFSNPDEFYALHLERSLADAGQGIARFVSLGCGNCDTEVRVVRILADRGITQFTLECVDINAAMLDRGRAMAAKAGVASQILTVQGDFNTWQPQQQQYDAIMANQSLHHVVELEHLFAAVASALTPHGRFITSDMIGRNGHMLWPEAAAILREYWRDLPDDYKYNVQLRRQENEFEDWDCSREGFEGIRAQDILTLLLDHFDFEFFMGFANIIDVVIGRSFGPNFDVKSADDRAFIDRVHARDQAEILAGHIKPTHMMAVMRRNFAGTTECWKNLTPEFCVRQPNPVGLA